MIGPMAIVSWTPERVVPMASRETWAAMVNALATDRSQRALSRVLSAAYQRAEGGDVQRVTLATDAAGEVLARARML